MHLLQAQPGTVTDGSEAVDLGQDPAEIAVLSAADTELANLAAARAELGTAYPALRLANIGQLGHNLSVDTYVERTLTPARLMVVRILGGASYWSYGLEQLEALAAETGAWLAALPGDDRADPELRERSTVPGEVHDRLWAFLSHGGPVNARNCLAYAAELSGYGAWSWAEPAPALCAGLYWPGVDAPSLDDVRAAWTPDGPVAAIVAYRAHVQAGTVEPVDELIASLRARGINPLPVFCQSLKEEVSAATVRTLLRDGGAELVVNTTGFAVASPGGAAVGTPFAAVPGPVLQAVISGGDRETWASGNHGLGPRDIAMNVALPEVDGRLLARAISFKAAGHWDPATQTSVVRHAPEPSRIAFTADLAAAWLRLRRTPRASRRVALVLANYPTKDSRLANGVGLDTPAATVNVLRVLRDAGYAVEDAPAGGDALIARLQAGPTNAGVAGRAVRETLGRGDYLAFFKTLPETVQQEVTARWGPPEADPVFLADRDAFALPVVRFGTVAVALQPARGYDVDPERTYHDPALVPPHAYLAFHAWLRRSFDAHAVVHMGKHGNLEWLPGKAVALSEACYPEAALGPLPNLYPFIVNDPGEGTQAKRRAQAVILDHLTPPLTRAESHGPMAELERLADEFHEAANLDPRRRELLYRDILDLAARHGLDADCGITAEDDGETALGKLDAHLCALKEHQIRDGLHIFGESPAGRPLRDLLTALARVPRGAGEGADASLPRALAADLGLPPAFDPLDADMGAGWTGPCPAVLHGLDGGAWRTAGDTLARLEVLAHQLVGGERDPDPAWTRTAAVLAWVRETLAPAVTACGAAELDGLLAGLDGNFVAPGPSGAPSRGRPDVLPTGRNFYAVDTRAVPTPAAWRLGWMSASRLVERHRQEEGAWPRHIALTAWGTATMRTGGDDLAQALALMGVQPAWDAAGRRVTGFDILPLSVLDRPRVDVTLRVSGFFRDAFPAQLDLLDSAARAVAELDEPAERNPIARAVARDADALTREGVDADTARRRAGHRVFSAQPGAYGAGLQQLVDSAGWRDDGDLAAAVVRWGGHAYGGGSAGTAEHAMFARRLAAADAVVHNQDNREHDILDSDDYYQFEGGLTAGVRYYAGAQPRVWHNDHSRPESPRIASLEHEVARVVRGRATNPKWIAGVMRHGYKGAFEMAATVDYLVAFAATARCVQDHHFDAVFDAYLGDPEVRGFLAAHNSEALTAIAERLTEAQDRGLWQPRGNASRPQLDAIRAGQNPEAIA